MPQRIQIPEAVIEIIKELEIHGHSAYLVGGYVRDKILNSDENSTVAEDFDIATSATPEEIKNVFPNDKIFSYGERHGTVTLRRSRINYEITTFRKEQGYSDGRRPDNVTFIGDLTTDLARRDFTVNAFALEIDGSIIDHFNGLTDLENKLIRAVGDPVERLQEDSLRIFRAIRFAVKLGFNIEEETKKAILDNRQLILEHKLSGERIFSELNGIIKNLPRGVMLLHDLGVLPILFSDYSTYVNIDWLFRLLKNRRYQDNQPTSDLVNWTILLHYILENTQSSEVPSTVNDIFTRYPGMGNDSTRYITHLIQFVRSFYNIVNLNNEVVYAVVLKIKDALNINTNPKQFFSELIQLLKILDDRWGVKNIENLEKVVQGLIPKLSQTMPLNGKDLVSIGYNGKSVGLLLKYLKILYYQDIHQDKYRLLEYVNHFNFDQNIFILEDYLVKYNLNLDEILEEFVMEALLAKIKIEYQLVANPDKAVVIWVKKELINFVGPFLKELGQKTILLNSHDELPENVIKNLDSLKIKHFRFKYHKKESIETLLDLSLTDKNTIIFNVK